MDVNMQRSFVVVNETKLKVGDVNTRDRRVCVCACVRVRVCVWRSK